MSCTEIDQMTGGALEVKFERFAELSREPKQVLNDQFETIWRMRELPAEHHTHAFILAWDLLMHIAEITTGKTDREVVFASLLLSDEIGGRYNGIMENPKALTRMYSKRFAETWPIFDSTDLTTLNILEAETQLRESTIQRYLANGARYYLPMCWPRHKQEAPELLPDWQHIFSAWFGLRWNLFSCLNWKNTEMETRITSNAFMSLIYFFKEGKLFFETPSMKPDIFDRSQIFSSL